MVMYIVNAEEFIHNTLKWEIFRSDGGALGNVIFILVSSTAVCF